MPSPQFANVYDQREARFGEAYDSVEPTSLLKLAYCAGAGARALGAMW